MKRTTFVVEFRRDGGFSEIEYKAVYAQTAQDAVDVARYIWNVYEVVDCYKQVKNWN